MKHIELTKKSALRQAETSINRPGNSVWKQLLTGIVLVASIGYGMTALWNPVTQDSISDAQKTELINSFSRLESVQVERVLNEDIQAAMDTMRLSPQDRQSLKSTLVNVDKGSSPGNVNGQVNGANLVWISLWDFASVDGDVVQLSSAGYGIEIPLVQGRVKVAVPVDATGQIKISGLRDGGGGITLGVQSGNAPISLPVLTVGQTITLPVTY